MNENMEIMENEVMETVEEIAPTGSGNGLKAVGGLLAIVGLAYGGYKLFKHRKAKKEKEASGSVDVIPVDPESVKEID